MYVEDIHMVQNVSELTKIHDTLLSLKPSHATHNEELCVLCQGGITGGTETTTEPIPERGDMSQLTEEDLQAAVANATKPLQEELAALKASQEQAAIEGRIAEMAEAHEAAIADLQSQLDVATAAATAAEQRYTELTSFLAEEQEKSEAQAALDARMEEVRAAVASRFPEDYISDNIERWAALAAEDFERMLSDMDVAAKAATSEKSQPAFTQDLLSSTAMTASADVGGTSAPNISDVRRNLMRNRHSVRSIGTNV